jgi:hypothetical protein
MAVLSLAGGLTRGPQVRVRFTDIFHVAFWLDCDATFFSRRAWFVKVLLGRGAGYVWGRTFYFGFIPRGRARAGCDRREGFVLGFTQNANHVPYTTH